MQVRLVDIANRVGVSRSTVDRALHGRGRIDEELREKILRIAAEMNYRPNTHARSLKTNVSGLIGVIMPTVIASFFAEIIQGISEECSRANNGLLFCLAQDQESVDNHLSLLLEKRVDGVILAPNPLVFDSRVLCQTLLDEGIPAVSVTRASGHPDVHSVLSDNVRGGYLATKYLLELGHRKIAYVSFSDNDALSRQRYKGYLQAMEEMGGQLDERYFVKADALDNLDARKLLDISERPTAVFASTDFIAASIIKQLQSWGMCVPQEMSVIGFDDIPLCTLVSPEISTISQPKRELGIAAYAQLNRKISGESVSDMVLDAQLIVRNSTAYIESP